MTQLAFPSSRQIADKDGNIEYSWRSFFQALLGAIGSSGSGPVNGPAASTNFDVATWSGTTGTLLIDSGYVLRASATSGKAVATLEKAQTWAALQTFNAGAAVADAGATGMFSPGTGQITWKLSSVVKATLNNNGLTLIGQLLSGGAVIPTTDNTVTCGSSTNRWTAVWAVNGAIQTSDERAKTKIGGVWSALRRAMHIRTISYFDVSGNAQVGVSAQQLRTVLPGAVYGDERRELLGIVESKIGVMALAALQVHVRRQRVVNAACVVGLIIAFIALYSH